jgi:hypothetical protein
LAKNGLGYFLGHFFTNSSGHPAWGLRTQLDAKTLYIDAKKSLYWRKKHFGMTQKTTLDWLKKHFGLTQKNTLDWRKKFFRLTQKTLWVDAKILWLDAKNILDWSKRRKCGSIKTFMASHLRCRTRRRPRKPL